MKKWIFLAAFLCMLPTMVTVGQDGESGESGETAKVEQLESYDEQNLSLVTKHAELGFANAQFNLGMRFYEGAGADQDFKQAATWLEKAAEQGNSDARYQIGLCYQKGHGVDRDYEEALRWYILAADQGSNAAKNNLGGLYEKGLGTTKDFKKAAKHYQSSADSGSAIGQYKLGQLYENGHGVEKDLAAAFQWQLKAANQGMAQAQNSVGLKYEVGEGVEKDVTTAIKWYKKSADQGYKWAQTNLGVMNHFGRGTDVDYKTAMEWYQRAAQQDDPRAQKLIGRLYADGKGVDRDYKQAASWYEKAAGAGDKESQNRLGLLYEKGNGVTQDYLRARTWYTKSAKKGYKWAQYNLAKLYENARGVTKDYNESTKWYRKAAEQGHATSQYELGDAYYFAQGVKEDFGAAAKWFRKAADQDYLAAQRDLGYMYFVGKGVSKNYAESVKWYKKAAERGDASSQYEYGLRYFDGKGVDKNKSTGLSWLRKSAEQNYKSAENKLGELYETGNGVSKNLRDAAEWYSRAAKHGHKKAKQSFASLTASVPARALLVGYDSYDKLPDIKGQTASLGKLAATLKEYNRFEDVRLLKPSQRVGDTIKTQIDANIVNDLVIVLTGYAFESEDGQLYLAGPKTDPKNPKRNSLSIKRLIKTLKDLPSYSRSVVFLDCNKQVATEEASDEDATSTGLDNARLMEEFESLDNVIAISAASEEELSYNSPKSPQNIFINAISSALKGSADQDDDSVISSEELYLYVLDNVQEQVGKLGFDQSPEINTFGAENEKLRALSYRTPKPFIKVRINNESNRKEFELNVKHKGGKTIRLPGRTFVDISCQSVTDITYFAGKYNGRGKWRKLYPAPTRSYTFRTTTQLSGGTCWTAGFVNSWGIHMTLIYPGTFEMGHNRNDAIAMSGFDMSAVGQMFNVNRERPRHAVTIGQPYYLGTYEITYGEFEKFVMANAYKTDAEELGYKNSIFGANDGQQTSTGYSWRNPGTGLAVSKRQPVVHITWSDAKRFCDALSIKEKAKYVLPTEPQWEYAARAGSQTAYWNGNDINALTKIANVRDRSWGNATNNQTKIQTSDGKVYTANVGSYKSNPFGLHDVHGNVWEWCRNRCYDYPTKPIIDDSDGL